MRYNPYLLITGGSVKFPLSCLWNLQLLENIGEFVELRSLSISRKEILTSNFGDLIIMKLKNGQAIVLANTSSGGIGPKHEDEIKLDGKDFGRLMARTVIIKVLASGAQPIALIANLSVEFYPTGSRIFQGIREEALKNRNQLFRLISRSYMETITANDNVLRMRYFTITLAFQLAI